MSKLRFFVFFLLVGTTVSALGAKVVVIPLGSSPANGLKVKAGSGTTIGTLAQLLSGNEILMSSDEGYFTAINGTGSVSSVDATEHIFLSHSDPDCLGDSYRPASSSLLKALVFMSRPTTSSDTADWKAVYTSIDSEVIANAPIQALSSIGTGCINSIGVSSDVFPVLVNDPAVTGFEFVDGDFQYPSPIYIE
jgi:hypothetical protein